MKALSVGLALGLTLFPYGINMKCAAKARAEVTGEIQSDALREISGIIASHVNPDVVWLHDDGRTNDLFAVRTTGETAAVLEWPNAMVDFEDIAMGPGPNPSEDYIYIGDIGDNDSRRPQVRVYRTTEPTIVGSRRPQTYAVEIVDFRFTYPDEPHDAEALLVDPLSGDILIITKEKKRSQVFRAPASSSKPRQAVTLELVAEVNVGNISAGDISRDGKWILLRSEKEGWLWPRKPTQTVSQALSAALPRKVPVRDKSQAKNGEAICFDATGSGYFTISEGKNQPLVLFPLPTSN